MTIAKDKLDAALARADADLDNSLERLRALLAIPSISTDPANAGDCLAAAEWLAAELGSLGFEASVRPTNGHPMVVAHDHAADGPHVLFYGHYDVQPVDPLDLWDSDPFTSEIRTGKNGQKIITGRGAADDKGQLMTFVEACRALKAEAGGLPVKVTMLFEGEEESGSPSLVPFLKSATEELRADIALVCDTGMSDADTPEICTMLRGLVGEEIEIVAADRDLHSGAYGSAARNPLQIAGDIVASLRNPDGSIAIAGIYDDVREISEDIKTMWEATGFDGEAYLKGVGLSIPAGEKSRSVKEQITSRPTCEINGLWGGYTDEGFKTVIPSKAHAKISFRLVADMDPEKVRAAFRKHVRDRVPADCSVSFTEHGGSPAVLVDTSNPFLAPARAALADEWNRDAVLMGSGGSIPVVSEFKQRLGMDSILIGFGLDDDNLHSPNEKYDLKSFHKGIRSWIRVLASFAD